MRVLVGTSGYDYDEWKGSFYPEGVPKAKRLPYYASQLGTVEINATYYRKPTQKQLDNWGAQVPDGFVFAFKAWQRITHQARLRDCAPLVDAFLTELRAAGPKLGVTLFGLPPNLKKDVPLLREFLNGLPRDFKCAFEFRHETWLADDVYAALKDANAALCIADTEELSTPFVRTAPFGYLRLRKPEYSDADLEGFAKQIRDASFEQDVAVYFKHEDEAKGPAFARRFMGFLAK
jgi:uncharacterized protein YecE (DUF72 family)